MLPIDENRLIFASVVRRSHSVGIGRAMKCAHSNKGTSFDATENSFYFSSQRLAHVNVGDGMWRACVCDARRFACVCVCAVGKCMNCQMGLRNEWKDRKINHLIKAQRDCCKIEVFVKLEFVRVCRIN